MDLPLFRRSAAALTPYFAEIAIDPKEREKSV